jgi:hypothetical protein
LLLFFEIKINSLSFLGGLLSNCKRWVLSSWQQQFRFAPGQEVAAAAAPFAAPDAHKTSHKEQVEKMQKALSEGRKGRNTLELVTLVLQNYELQLLGRMFWP